MRKLTYYFIITLQLTSLGAYAGDHTLDEPINSAIIILRDLKCYYPAQVESLVFNRIQSHYARLKFDHMSVRQFLISRTQFAMGQLGKLESDFDKAYKALLDPSKPLWDEKAIEAFVITAEVQNLSIEAPQIQKDLVALKKSWNEA